MASSSEPENLVLITRQVRTEGTVKTDWLFRPSWLSSHTLKLVVASGWVTAAAAGNNHNIPYTT